MSHRDYGACMDCKQAYDCGVGGYITSMTHHRTVSDFDAQLAEHGLTLETIQARAKAWRAFLALHEGHSIQHWDSSEVTCLSPCPCAQFEDDGNAEAFCHRCGRQFRAFICSECVGTGKVPMDPVAAWAAEGGDQIARAVALLRPNCAACDGWGCVRRGGPPTGGER
jgi:hypothetical protein